MRKIALYHLLNVFVLLVYGTLILLQHYFTIFPLKLSLLWCPLLLIMEGLMMIIKTLLFHSRTSLWFGLVLFLWGASFLFVEYMNYQMIALLPACLFSVSFVGIILAIIYRDGIQLDIGITCFLVAIPLVFFVMGTLKVWLTAVLCGVAFVVSIVIIKFIPEKKVL